MSGKSSTSGRKGAATPARLTDSQRGLAVAFSGSVAGLLSRTVTAPFDRIRIVSAGAGLPIGAALRLIRQERTVAAFWRGNFVNCLKIVPEQGIRLSCADAFKRHFYGSKGKYNDNNVTIPQRFAAGAFGGICGQAAVYPMEVVRTQIATSSPGQNKSLWDCASRLYSHQGPSAFYRGIKPSLVGIIPYAGFEIAFYEALKKYWEAKRGKRLHPLATMTTGAVASAGAQVLTYPLALVRTRMQAQASIAPAISMRHCIMSVARADGIGGFYRGLSANMLKMAPAAAIQWMAYDTLKRNLGVADERGR